MGFSRLINSCLEIEEGMRAKNILVRPKKGREYLLPKKFTPKIFLGRI